MIKSELKKAKKELLRVRTKNALRITTKAASLILCIALPPVIASCGVNSLDRKDDYYYEKVSVDNNGNEESLGLIEKKDKNTFKVYTNCNETDDGYVKTYEIYSSSDIDSTAFSYIHNKDDLTIMLGTPTDNGYEIDNKEIDLDKDYASVIEYRKSDVKKDSTISIPAIVAGGLLGLWMDLAILNVYFELETLDKIDEVFGNVDKSDVESAKAKVKTLKMKKKE